MVNVLVGLKKIYSKDIWEEKNKKKIVLYYNIQRSFGDFTLIAATNDKCG